MKTKKYPESYIIGQSIAIGIPIGIPIGLALGNIALGPAIGATIGLIIGTRIEKKYKKEGKIRPLTQSEKKRRKKNIHWVLIITIITAISILAAYLLYPASLK